MKLTLTPKIDIVLSDGVFLRRGSKMEVEVSEKDLAFISPYITVVNEATVVEEPQPQTQPVKRGRKAKPKDELE